MPYLLGLDVGTSGTKALLTDETGQVVAKATVEYPLRAPRPGWAEQEAEEWWRAAREGIRQVLAKAAVAPGAIAGVGLSGQMHGAVLLDGQGEVVRPPILWCDGRTTEECREMEALVGGRDRLISLTGNPALEGFTAPKLLWVRKHEPEVYGRIRWVLLPKDYVRYRLTGQIATDISDAAGTLLFDVVRRSWSAPVLEALGLNAEWMPDVLESSRVCGHVTEEAARQTGLVAGTPVVAGGADNTCGAVGAGVVEPGQALVSIGSSGVVLVVSEAPVLHPQGIVHTFNHSVPGTWYLMGVMLAAGLSLRWVRDELGHVEQAAARLTGQDAYDLLAQEAAQAPPGCAGLFFLPYLNGERTPHADASARGVWFGLSTAHRRAHLVRSVFEGITYGLRDCLEPIRAMGVAVRQARAIGGGAKSAFWRRLQADVLDVEVARLANDEGPAFGAAVLAGVGTGVFADVVQAVRKTVAVVDTVAPDPEAVRHYESQFQFYRSLYPALRERFAAGQPSLPGGERREDADK